MVESAFACGIKPIRRIYLKRQDWLILPIRLIAIELGTMSRNAQGQAIAGAIIGLAKTGRLRSK